MMSMNGLHMRTCVLHFFPVAAEVKPKTEAEGTSRPEFPPPHFISRLVTSLLINP